MKIENEKVFKKSVTKCLKTPQHKLIATYVVYQKSLEMVCETENQNQKDEKKGNKKE